MVSTITMARSISSTEVSWAGVMMIMYCQIDMKELTNVASSSITSDKSRIDRYLNRRGR